MCDTMEEKSVIRSKVSVADGKSIYLQKRLLSDYLHIEGINGDGVEIERLNE